jgi:hypothetical protein
VPVGDVSTCEHRPISAEANGARTASKSAGLTLRPQVERPKPLIPGELDHAQPSPGTSNRAFFVRGRKAHPLDIDNEAIKEARWKGLQEGDHSISTTPIVSPTPVPRRRNGSSPRRSLSVSRCRVSIYSGAGYESSSNSSRSRVESRCLPSQDSGECPPGPSVRAYLDLRRAGFRPIPQSDAPD